MFVTKWPSEIGNLLMLLKLLPHKPTGKNCVASAHTFKDSIGKLIVFSNVIHDNFSTSQKIGPSRYKIFEQNVSAN